MNLLMFLVFGLVVGAIARWIVPGRESGGWATSILIGVLGSFVGGFLGPLVGVAGGRPAGFVMSIIGAVVLLAAHHAFTGRRSYS